VKSGPETFSRRSVIGAGLAGVAAALLPGCSGSAPVEAPFIPQPADPKLAARASTPHGSAAKGTSTVYSSADQNALLYVPTNYQPTVPAPLVLMFHGAAIPAAGPLHLFAPYADAAGLVLLSVDSFVPTWDVISTGAYGADLAFVNASLKAAFNVVNVDPARVCVEGFSDGATYALALGISNGDLFSHVIAFSAGFIPPFVRRGKPKFFESHGVNDPILPIDEAGRVISQELIADGYDVDYVEFDGVHEAPAPIVQQAIAWLAT
jgi:phospholipase/carboxylesterase